MIDQAGHLRLRIACLDARLLETGDQTPREMRLYLSLTRQYVRLTSQLGAPHRPPGRMLSNLRGDPEAPRGSALIERQVPSKLESYLAELASELIGKAA